MRLIKEIVFIQQRIIENFKAEKQELNLIFNDVPASDITIDDRIRIKKRRRKS